MRQDNWETRQLGTRDIMMRQDNWKTMLLGTRDTMRQGYYETGQLGDSKRERERKRDNGLGWDNFTSRSLKS
jgi:hypothetical protein